MEINISKGTLEKSALRSNYFYFRPDKIKCLGIFTHGYTASKTDLLSWATKLSHEGMACIIFDLPGHYLSSFNEISSLDSFTNNTHFLFEQAYKVFNDDSLDIKSLNLSLGGHSLGALMALKASKLESFKSINKQLICVGFGMAPITGEHIFQSSFYKSTLNIRASLVSEHIHPDVIFPWLKKEKEMLNIENKKIHLIVGKDDLVVPPEAVEKMYEKLQGLNNIVTLDTPLKLAHHQPEQAGSFIKKYLKSLKIF